MYWYNKTYCSHRLAAKYGMIPVYKENFANLYEQKVKDSRHSNLLRRMGALEVSENSELVKIVN